MNSLHDIIDDNFSLHARVIQEQTEGMQVHTTEHLTFSDCGLSCDTFNIVHIRQGERLTTKELTKVLSYYGQKQFAFTIWVEESQLTENVRAIFNQLSIKLTNKEPGMVLNLNDFTQIADEKFANIRQVTTLTEVAAMAEIVAQNWQPPDKNLIRYYTQVSPLIINGASKTMYFLYFDNNKPVASIEVLYSDSDKETVGLYSLSTLDAYRGRGIGSALMAYSLNKAKRMGCKNAVLQASDDGYKIYQRLGFKTLTHYYEYH